MGQVKYLYLIWSTLKNKKEKIIKKNENINNNFFLYFLLKNKLNEKIISKDKIAFLSPDKITANIIMIKHTEEKIWLYLRFSNFEIKIKKELSRI